MASLIARDHREDKEFSSRSLRRRATATHAAAQSEEEGSNDSKEQDDEQLPASVLPICLGACIFLCIRYGLYPYFCMRVLSKRSLILNPLT
jgi:hypothetical protein